MTSAYLIVGSVGPGTFTTAPFDELARWMTYRMTNPSTAFNSPIWTESYSALSGPAHRVRSVASVPNAVGPGSALKSSSGSLGRLTGDRQPRSSRPASQRQERITEAYSPRPQLGLPSLALASFGRSDPR